MGDLAQLQHHNRDIHPTRYANLRCTYTVAVSLKAIFLVKKMRNFSQIRADLARNCAGARQKSREYGRFRIVSDWNFSSAPLASAIRYLESKPLWPPLLGALGTGLENETKRPVNRPHEGLLNATIDRRRAVPAACLGQHPVATNPFGHDVFDGQLTVGATAIDAGADRRKDRFLAEIHGLQPSHLAQSESDASPVPIGTMSSGRSAARQLRASSATRQPSVSFVT